MADIHERVDAVVLGEALDRAGQAMASLAPSFWRYYKALVDEGFTAEQALMLTLEVQRLVLTGQTLRNGGET